MGGRSSRIRSGRDGRMEIGGAEATLSAGESRTRAPSSRGSSRGSALPLKRRRTGQFTDRAEPRVYSRLLGRQSLPRADHPRAASLLAIPRATILSSSGSPPSREFTRDSSGDDPRGGRSNAPLAAPPP